MANLMLKFECEYHPQDLAETCNKCQNVSTSCTIGLLDCPFAETKLSCKDITPENWDFFIRGNLDMDSLFRK